MGEPGRFGVPELTVLVRELCWSLGRMNKRHLATVLIGTGLGNLVLGEAVSAWMDGIRRAITGSSYDQEKRVCRITFVEKSPERLPHLHRMLNEVVPRQRRFGLEIAYFGPSRVEFNRAKEDDRKQLKKALNERWNGRGSETKREGPNPTRVTLSLDAARKAYRFGAITDNAAVPEREVTIDPAVVWAANDELAGERGPRMQRERGRFLEALLIPDELRGHLYNDAPLVMLLDATTRAFTGRWSHSPN